jgi:hypothetical protein
MHLSVTDSIYFICLVFDKPYKIVYAGEKNSWGRIELIPLPAVFLASCISELAADPSPSFFSASS